MGTERLAALPFWASGLLVVVLPTLLAVLGAGFVRRRAGLELLARNNEVAGFKFAVVGVIYAVLLGFAVIVVWEKFHDAESAATREAAAVVGLYRLAGEGELRGVALRARLDGYVKAAVGDEWPAMGAGHASKLTGARLTELYAAAASSAPTGTAGPVVLAEMFHQLDTIVQARRERLALAGGIVPDVLWAALAFGACLTVGFTFFFGTPSLAAQMAMTGALAALIGMGLLVIVSIDHPFTGPVNVSAEPLTAVLAEFGGG